MSFGMDETFAAALRELLVDQGQHARDRRRWLPWPQRWSLKLGVTIAILVGGGGIAAATEAVLAGGPPGSQRISALAAPVTVTGDGTETVQLGAPPLGANAIYTYLSCLTPGTFAWPDGASEICKAPVDAANSIAHPAMYTLSLKPGQTSVEITAAQGEKWRLTARYVDSTTSAWAVNASGQTYGAANRNGTPDLVAVIATNGRSGYVYSSQLNPPPASSPAAALAEQAANTKGEYIPVYESDGTTIIGRFEVAEPGAIP